MAISVAARGMNMLLSNHSAPPNPRLVASQLRRLFANAHDANAVAAGHAILDRYVRAHSAQGALALREGATALMAGLAPDRFDPTFWNATNPSGVRAKLGASAAVFDVLQTQLRAVVAQSPVRVKGASGVSESNATQDMVLTITGETMPRAHVYDAVVVVACHDVGTFPQAHWHAANDALRVVAPLIMRVPNRREIIKRLLTASGEERALLLNSYTCALRDTVFEPPLRVAMVASLPHVSSAYVRDFVRVVAPGFRAFVSHLTVTAGMRALVELEDRAWDALVPMATRTESGAQWAAAIGLVIAGLPDMRARRSDLVILLADVAVSARTPEAVLQIVECLSSESTDAKGLVHATRAMFNDRPVDVNVFTAAMRALQSVPVSARQHVVMALSRFSLESFSAAKLLTSAKVIAMFEMDEWVCFLGSMGWLLKDARRIGDDLFEEAMVRMARQSAPQRQMMVTLMATCVGQYASTTHKICLLCDLDMLHEEVLGQLQGLSVRAPQLNLRGCVEAIHGLPVQAQLHVVDCLVRLAPQNHGLHGLFQTRCASEHLAPMSIARRELLVTHLESLGVDLRANGAALGRALHGLGTLNAGHRAAVLRAYRRLDSPALSASDRCDVVTSLTALPIGDLAEFVQSCRMNVVWRQLNTREIKARVSEMHARFEEGERPEPYGPVDLQSVHRAHHNQRAIDSIHVLVSMPRIPTTHGDYVRQVSTLIDNLERSVPLDHPDRNIAPGRTRTLFDDARHALHGPKVGSEYGSFKDNDETFSVSGNQCVRIGDVGNFVWQTIVGYPAQAKTPPKSYAALAADATAMERNYIVQLAACIENGERVCYAGKLMRILNAVQGFIEGVGVDDLDALDAATFEPDETVPVGALLSMRSAAFASRYADPLPEQVTAFVANAVASSEQQWSAPDSPERQAFRKQLREYVTMTYEACATAQAACWESGFLGYA